MNNQPKDKCIECDGVGKHKNPIQGYTIFDCPTCKGAERHTGEGETMEERLKIVYRNGLIDGKQETNCEAVVVGEALKYIALALQEQREEMEQIVYGSMRTGGDVVVTTLLNGEIKKIVKAIKNLK